MFTFSLTTFIAPLSLRCAANQTVGALTLLADEPPNIAKQKICRGKRARPSKFYRHAATGKPFAGEYLVERKDGRFYYAFLNGKKEVVEKEDGSIYERFRQYINNGTWIETTMEKERPDTN